MNKSRTYFTALVALTTASSFRPANGATQLVCAKFNLSAAATCAELKVEADLKECHDEAMGVPRVECRGGQAVISVRGKAKRYSAVAHLTASSGGAWQESVWKVIRVRGSSLDATPHVVQAVTKELKAREPAGNVPMPTLASQPSAPVAVPSLAPAPIASSSPLPAGIQLSGYFDGYVAHNFNRPAISTPVAGSSLAPPQTSLHYYDWTSDQLSLNLVELTLKAQRAETSVLVDLDFGQQADMNAQAATLSSAAGPVPGAADEIAKHIGQAVLTYTPSAAPALVLEGGKMYTHVGLETPKAKDNWNYSRSSIFGFGLPVWHTGVHGGYALIPDRLSIGLYLYEGWNTIYAVNRSPTYGAQLKWTPSAQLAWVYNYLGGAEQPGNNANWRQVHETNVTYTFGPSFAVAADLMVGRENGATLLSGDSVTATWGGAQVGAKWQVSPKWSLAPRVEVYRDSQGYTLGGEAQTLTGFTLTPAYQVSEGLEARFELRLDRSTSSTRFISASGPSGSQAVLLLGILYNF